MNQVQEETETKGGRALKPLPDTVKTGWIPLSWWLVMNPGHTRGEALEFCNPNSRRTGKMFNPKQVREVGRGRYDVWHQSLNHVTGTYSPEIIDRPNRGSLTRTQVSRKSSREPLTPAPTLPNGESQRSSARPAPSEQVSGGDE